MDISYLMIVLNGMPFIKYSLRDIYPYAKEIIIVEGSIPSFNDSANHNGSSKDGTVNFIKNYPGNKIKFIQGKWKTKIQMQNEGLKYVTGDYVWIIDVDEFYRDYEKIFNTLNNSPEIDEIWFKTYNFFKGLDYYIYHPILEKDIWAVKRIFKYFSGMQFNSHRPPQTNFKGDIKFLIPRNIYLYHYGYLYDSQVKAKINIHKTVLPNCINPNLWYKELFKKWTPQNREQLEKKYTVWMGAQGAITKKFEDIHPKSVIEMYKNEMVTNHNNR